MIETRKGALESFRAESLESFGSKAPEALKNFAFQGFGDESSEKLLYALLITLISKKDYTDFPYFSMNFLSVKSVHNLCNQRFLDFFRNLVMKT